MKYLFSSFIWIMVFPAFLHAQQWEVGTSIGGASYIGDLNPTNTFKLSGFHTGVFIKRDFDGYFGTSFQYNFGNIVANDANSKNEVLKERNLNVNTNLNEVSFVLEFNFLQFMQGVGKHRFTPFVYSGIGAVFFQPTTIYQGNRYNLAHLRTEDQLGRYNTSALVIPYGFGARLSLKENLQLISKVGFREAFTDYLDDVSGFYPDKNNLDALRAALSDRSGEITGIYKGDFGVQRGDLRKRDRYMFVGIGISYTFVTSKCY